MGASAAALSWMKLPRRGRGAPAPPATTMAVCTGPGDFGRQGERAGRDAPTARPVADARHAPAGTRACGRDRRVSPREPAKLLRNARGPPLRPDHRQHRRPEPGRRRLAASAQEGVEAAQRLRGSPAVSPMSGQRSRPAPRAARAASEDPRRPAPPIPGSGEARREQAERPACGTGRLTGQARRTASSICRQHRRPRAPPPAARRRLGRASRPPVSTRASGAAFPRGPAPRRRRAG